MNNYFTKLEDITEGRITLLQREDGNYALPGGLYTTNQGYARAIAKRLDASLSDKKKAKLIAKSVNRQVSASREGVDLVLGV